MHYIFTVSNRFSTCLFVSFKLKRTKLTPSWPMIIKWCRST